MILAFLLAAVLDGEPSSPAGGGEYRCPLCGIDYLADELPFHVGSVVCDDSVRWNLIDDLCS